MITITIEERAHINELDADIAHAQSVLDKIGRNNQAWARGRKSTLRGRIARLEQERRQLLQREEK